MDAVLIINACLGALGVLCVFIMNGVRNSIKELSANLHELNNLVRADYIPREETEKKFGEIYESLEGKFRYLQSVVQKITDEQTKHGERIAVLYDRRL